LILNLTTDESLVQQYVVEKGDNLTKIGRNTALAGSISMRQTRMLLKIPILFSPVGD